MSEELRAWLGEIEERNPGPEASRSDFDALITKCEELAGALDVYADPNRWEIAYDVDTGDIADDRHVFVTDDSEPWGVAKSALRAPGGGGP